MKKVDELLNIQKAILINEQLRKELKENEDPNVIGQDGISKKIAELEKQKAILQAEVKERNARIKKINAQIEMWSKQISPNQTRIPGFDF